MGQSQSLDFNSFENLLSFKRNSFSKEFLLTYEDSVKELIKIYSSNDSFLQYTKSGSGVISMLVDSMSSIDANILLTLVKKWTATIHAKDEYEAPMSYSMFDRQFGNAAFIIRFDRISSTFHVWISCNEKLETILSHDSLYGGIGTLEARRNVSDIGFIKSIMTLNKEYGIQNLLLIVWNIFHANCDDITNSEIHLVLKPGNFNLSTFSIKDKRSLALQGRAKIIDHQYLDDLRYVLNNELRYVFLN